MISVQWKSFAWRKTKRIFEHLKIFHLGKETELKCRFFFLVLHLGTIAVSFSAVGIMNLLSPFQKGRGGPQFE